MRETSGEILDMHLDKKKLLTLPLSEIVFKACGHIMINTIWRATSPIYWIGHDVVAQYFIHTEN